LRPITQSIIRNFLLTLGVCCVLFSGRQAFAQADQGTITGVVKDSAGAVIQNAQVTLTNTDTGLVLQVKSDGSGVYVFSPIKIGNYEVSATAPGFQTTTQQHVHLDIQQRLNVVIGLKPGNVSQSVTVSNAPAVLQSQTASVGQVISTQTINNTPLNGRNWVYIAQLTAGVVPSISGNSRGGGTGDFFANGQRATQNNFILDGVDNNVNVDDFMNGASYNVRPPPDALAEFKIDTADYSAEFGHSAGAVVSASIKSGTNQIHGDVWEYFRNTNLDATDWNATTIPTYHENQFGATLGFPIWQNKLFYFGDAEANRIVFGAPIILTVPTPLMRQGNFTELFNPALTGKGSPTTLYAPNSGGATPLTCGNPTPGQTTTNILCTNQIDSVASNLVSLFPVPNAGGWNSSNNSGSGTGGLTYNNLNENINDQNNTWQWDQRVDWNISAKDQTYARYSYQHQQANNPPPLGPILDGGSNSGGFQGASDFNLGESFMASETHIFSPSLSNELRFGYNWGNFQFLQANSDKDISSQLGLGGVPFEGTAEPNGGLPYFTMTDVSSFGARADLPSIERQNIYQILDNVTKIVGNHSLKFGVDFQSIRTSLSQPYVPRGRYHYGAYYTGAAGASHTGWDIGDLLTNNMLNTEISPDSNVSYYRWYRSAYAQDDWRVTNKLTVNLGLRYDYVQPISNNAGELANFVQTSPIGQIGTGSGIFELPTKIQNTNPLPPAFLALLSSQNVTVQYVNSLSLTHAQKDNFGPRVGFAYQVNSKSVIRGAYGVFYGGIEAPGAAELTVNFPWSFNSVVYNPSACIPGSCPSTATAAPPTLPYPTTLETGLSAYLANGVKNFFSNPSINASDVNIHTPYTESYNLTVEREFSSNLVAALGYVGNSARHLYTGVNTNQPNALVNPGANAAATQSFPNLSEFFLSSYQGESYYNGLQAKIEKRYANGLSFLTTYTWAHAFDDSTTPGGIEGGINPRNTNIIPLVDELTNSAFDVRNRFTFNGFYELPFGRGKRYLHDGGWTNVVAGGWAASLTFTAQTGTPFTVYPDSTTANGGTANAIRIGDPFAPGGTPPPSNPYISSCPSSVRNRTNWYNPCAFANPLDGSLIPVSGPGSQVTGISNAIAYLGGKSNQIYGPGYNRVNMSAFKNFATWREQYLQFRVDAFNLLNHPTLGTPFDTSNDATGGGISSPQVFQNFTPDSRFFQLSAKYVF
jgi:hypothetical protein